MTTASDTLAALGDGGDAIRVLAGDCTVIHDCDRRTEHRGHVTVIVKPDNTVLVHDAEGYQPVAWITRADAVSCTRGSRRREAAVSTDVPATSPVPDSSQSAGEARSSATSSTTGSASSGDGPTLQHGVETAAFAVDAQDGDERLRVRAHVEDGYAAYPTTRAGRPVGECPECDGTLVRAGRAVSCIGCGTEHGLPDGATVREERCECGYPRLRVERGAPLSVCLDRNCDPLLAAVRDRFDRTWDCPRCGSDLRVLRRGGLIAGCESYPDCEASFSIPAGTVVDDCDCGLPVFETSRGRRCLDTSCEARTAGD